MVGRSTAPRAAALVLCSGCGPNVTLTVTSPIRVDASVYQGASGPSVVIAGRLSGDVAALKGHALYLLAVVTFGFPFDGTPAVHSDSDGLGGDLQLFGETPLAGVANDSGTIRLHACLDADCTQELRVVNGEIPYTIQVKKGLSVATMQPIFAPLRAGRPGRRAQVRAPKTALGPRLPASPAAPLERRSQRL